MAAILAGSVGFGQPSKALSTEPLRLSALNFDSQAPRNKRFGALEFIAGFSLRLDDPRFGGFSGLEITEAGEETSVAAVTDRGAILTGRLRFDRSGAMTGIDGAKLLDLELTGHADAEALSRARDGSWRIAFERQHRISRFSALTAQEEPLPALPFRKALKLNDGLESLAILPDGRALLISEAPSGRTLNAWVLTVAPPTAPQPRIKGARAPYPPPPAEKPLSLSIARKGGFLPTDLALGPDGRWLYLLERRFSWIGGVAMRIRRFAVADIRADTTLEGETLIEAGNGYAVDNMEGIAARRGRGGNTELFVISDDNFSPIQRTILLQFRVLR